MSPEHTHPSIPVWATYNAIDNPDLFQKYVWAWLEKTLKKRYQALAATQNELIVYKDHVPMLPYFHCSAGFTWTAQEKRWWSDTPYLQSRLDFKKCSSFEWHGVWLSGVWADRWARLWFSYKQIIDYYYNGLKIINI